MPITPNPLAEYCTALGDGDASVWGEPALPAHGLTL